MSYIAISCNVDGPMPGQYFYSIFEFGAVVIKENITQTFRGEMSPLSGQYVPKTFDRYHSNRNTVLLYDQPSLVIPNFKRWLTLNNVGVMKFVSDDINDWSFMSYYLNFYDDFGKENVGKEKYINPFNNNFLDLNNVYRGIKGQAKANIEELIGKKSMDAEINAKKLADTVLQLKKEYGFKITLQ